LKYLGENVVYAIASGSAHFVVMTWAIVRSLLEMYVQNLRVQSEDCRYAFQANYKCPCYSYFVTLLRLIALMPIQV